MQLQFLSSFLICGIVCNCNGTLTTIDKISIHQSDLLDATWDFVRIVFVPKIKTLHLIYGVADVESTEISRLLYNQLVKMSSTVLPIFNENVDIHETRINRRRIYSVLFIDNFISFRNFFENLSPQYFLHDGYILVVLVSGMMLELPLVTEQFWNINMFNINFIVDDSGRILLLTFKPFDVNSCGDTSPFIINEYVNGSYLSSAFFPQKIKNLHECHIKVVTFNCPPMVMIRRTKNNSYDISGIDGELLKGIAKILNFTIQIVNISDTIRWGTLDDNGTSTGAMKMVIDGEVDFTIGMYTITSLRNKYMTSSQSYFTIPFLLIIPPGAQFSPFKKLFRPFRDVVWILILLTFVIGFVVIFVVKFQSNVIKDFVLGIKNDTPFLNIFNIFFGGSMNLMPSRNFARFLLTTFVIFCFVIRTLYQGALFQFLQKEDRAKEAQTIDELIERNFIFYMLPASFETTKNMKFANR